MQQPMNKCRHRLHHVQPGTLVVVNPPAAGTTDFYRSVVGVEVGTSIEEEILAHFLGWGPKNVAPTSSFTTHNPFYEYVVRVVEPFGDVVHIVTCCQIERSASALDLLARSDQNAESVPHRPALTSAATTRSNKLLRYCLNKVGVVADRCANAFSRAAAHL